MRWIRTLGAAPYGGREGFVDTPQLLPGSGGATGELEREKSLGTGVTGQGAVGSNCHRVGFD